MKEINMLAQFNFVFKSLNITIIISISGKTHFHFSSFSNNFRPIFNFISLNRNLIKVLILVNLKTLLKIIRNIILKFDW